MNNIPNYNEIIETFRSGNVAALHNMKNKIVQIFESDDLALQQNFLNQYLPKFSIKAVMIQTLKGSPEWAVAALSATAQIYAYKRPYELGTVLGDVCYQLAREALNLGKPGELKRYLYFGGEGAQSCVIALKELNQNEGALAYLNKIIPWFEQYNDTEILPSLYLHRIEVNLALQRFQEASTLLNQLEEEQLPPVDQQTYKRLKQLLGKKMKSVTELSSEQLNESDQVFNTLNFLLEHVKPLLKSESEAKNDFDRLEKLFEKLKLDSQNSLIAKDFALAQLKSESEAKNDFDRLEKLFEKLKSERLNCLTAKDFALAQQESRDILLKLKTGESEAVTAHTIIETIDSTFAKLLELSKKHD